MMTEFVTLLFSRSILFALLYGTLFLFQAARIDLFHQRLDTAMMCASAWLVLWAVSVFNAAKPAGVIAAIFLAWVTITRGLPGIATSAETVIVSGQARMERVADRLAQDEPLMVPCDRTTIESLVFFTENLATGHPTARLWYSIQEDRITCWDRPGVHPHTMRHLEPITPSIVARIARQVPPADTPAEKTGTDGFLPVHILPPPQGFRPIEVVRIP